VDITALFLSRLQFAFTVSFHIIYPSLTIGLASWLTVLETLNLATRRPAKHISCIFFGTCVRHQPGVDLLTRVIPAANILFASEAIGVLGVDPETGHHFDDTKRYVGAAPSISDAEPRQIFEANALRVYPRLARYFLEYM
jgi:hypothetical protein